MIFVFYLHINLKFVKASQLSDNLGSMLKFFGDLKNEKNSSDPETAKNCLITTFFTELKILLNCKNQMMEIYKK